MIRRLCSASVAFGFFVLLSSCDSSSTSPTDSVGQIPVPVRAPIWDTTTYGIAWNPAVTYDSILDVRDNQVYRTVYMWPLHWMAQNLNFKVDSSWCASGSTDSCGKYGRLYSWSASLGLPAKYDTIDTIVSNTTRGICPLGWRLPTATEWGNMESNSARQFPGLKLKSSQGWNGKNGLDAGTDVVGFRILPAGDRDSKGTFRSLSISRVPFATFWTTEAVDARTAFGYEYQYGDSGTIQLNAPKSYGGSVRCVK